VEDGKDSQEVLNGEGFDFFLNLLLTYLPPVPMDNFRGLDLNSPSKLRSTKTPSPRKFSGICLCRFRFFAPQPSLFCDQGIIIIIIIKHLLKIFNECRSLTGVGELNPY
jgi:hypothetical protein